MRSRDLELLQAMPVFGGLSREALELLVEKGTSIAVPKGEYLVREGESGQSLYVLRAGAVAILKHWEGKDYLLGRHGPGDCVGEMALIEFAPRSASVFAELDCDALKITGETLHALYEANLEQFAMLQMNMGREVSRRLREHEDKLFRAQVTAEIIGDELLSYETGSGRSD